MKRPSNPKDQLKAFRKAAREVGADDNEERFRETLRTLGQAKPKTDSEIKKMTKRSGRSHRS